MSHNPFFPPDGMNSKKFYFLLWKRYFDMGYGITSYIKWAFAVMGLRSDSWIFLFNLGAIYFILCVGIGWIWYRFGFMELDTEIGNRFNIFVKEMREMKEHTK